MQKYIKTMRERVCGRDGGGYNNVHTHVIMKAHISDSTNATTEKNDESVYTSLLFSRSPD